MRKEHEKCANCIYFHKLKHNFKRSVGFEKSTCCDALIRIDDYEDGWIQEVDEKDFCELFTLKKEDVNGKDDTKANE